MFPANERLLKTGKIAQAPNNGRDVDNDVLLSVEHKYSLMDQQHARLRAEALTTRRNSGHQHQKHVTYIRET